MKTGKMSIVALSGNFCSPGFSCKSRIEDIIGPAEKSPLRRQFKIPMRWF